MVDREFIEGSTRFLNHSCDLNYRQFTVSLDRDIPADTELTFNYINDDEDALISD